MLPWPPWLRAVVVVLGAVTFAAPVRGQDVPHEDQLKAAFLFRFAQFVEWPAPALDGRPNLEYCIWPPNPFGTVLAELIAGETVQGRPLVLRNLTATASLSTCHVLYLHGPSASRVLDRLAKQPTLTVGDAPNFLEAGGIIELVRRDNRLQFNISLQAAERAGLRLSSRLLELAGNLRRGRS